MNHKKVLSALFLTMVVGLSGVSPTYADDGQPALPTPEGAQVVVSKSVDYQVKTTVLPGGPTSAISSGPKTLNITLAILRYDHTPWPSEYQAQTTETLTGPYFSVDFYVSTVVGGYPYSGGHAFASIGGTNPATTWGPKKECATVAYVGNRTQSEIHWIPTSTETRVDSVSALCYP